MLKLTGPGSLAEMPAFLDAITTNETYFLSRPPAIIEWLEPDVSFPSIARTGPTTGSQPLRIWSAACASGEEAYSIALKVLASHRATSRAVGSVTILGTDLSGAALESAKARLSTTIERCIWSSLDERQHRV